QCDDWAKPCGSEWPEQCGRDLYSERVDLRGRFVPAKRNAGSIRRLRRGNNRSQPDGTETRCEISRPGNEPAGWNTCLRERSRGTAPSLPCRDILRFALCDRHDEWQESDEDQSPFLGAAG